MTASDQQSVSELPDRYFNTPVCNTETGDIERLQRDHDTNEVVVLSPNGDEEWDRTEAIEFTRDLYDPIPQPAVDDPVGYIEAVLDGEENPLGVTGTVQQDIAQRYAKDNVEIIAN